MLGAEGCRFRGSVWVWGSGFGVQVQRLSFRVKGEGRLRFRLLEPDASGKWPKQLMVLYFPV